jgi:FeS assembly SUF system protein
MTPEEKKHLEERVIDMLKSVYDPEIPVDIYELGLIYEVNISDDLPAGEAGAHVGIKMTLTSPACPVAESLPNEVEQKVASVQGVSSAKVEITFEPPWDRTMMSEAAQLELGFM